LPLRAAAGSGDAHRAHEAAKDADVIYTDVWTSMGQEKPKLRSAGLPFGFQVDDRCWTRPKDVLFMHPLPAHPGEEISPDWWTTRDRWSSTRRRTGFTLQKALLAKLLANDRKIRP
jgi:ornithine carbamoyltransferase